jgi:hypothetical protein
MRLWTTATATAIALDLTPSFEGDTFSDRLLAGSISWLHVQPTTKLQQVTSGSQENGLAASNCKRLVLFSGAHFSCVRKKQCQFAPVTSTEGYYA